MDDWMDFLNYCVKEDLKNRKGKQKTENDIVFSFYVYGNEEKVDDLLGRIYFTVVSQFEFQTKNGKSLNSKFKVGLNKVFSKLGLPEIEMEFDGNVEHEKIKSVVSSITFDTKVNILVSYYKKNSRYPYINLLNGNYYEYKDNKVINKENYFEGIMVGRVRGTFSAKRIYPPVESALVLSGDDKIYDVVKKIVKPNVIGDFMDGKNSLWVLHSINNSVIQCEIPIYTRNIRYVTQSGMLELYQEFEYPIDSIGVMRWKDGLLMCDPIAINLDHNTHIL